MSTRRRAKPGSRRRAGPTHRPRREWPAALGEVTLLALVLAVPLIINRKSINYADVKDLVCRLRSAVTV